MKPVMLIIGACMVILLMGAVLTGIQDVRSESHTEAHSLVTTAAAATTANVTLVEDLFGDRTSEVTSVTSNLTSDVPLVSTYTASNNNLLISGLTVGETRTLTVVYKIGRLTDFFSVDVAVRAWPMFLVLGVIGIIAGAVYSASRRGE